MFVSCDVGYGYTKSVSGSGRRALLPSVVAPRRSTGELAAALGSAAPRHALDLHLDGDGAPERYWIGQAALDAGASRDWEAEASARAGYGVLVLAGAALTGAEGRIELAVGLPMAVWLRGRDERRALRERLEGLAGWVSVDGEPARRLEIVRARVYPQALGAAVVALQDLGFGEGTVGLVDVGYRTTDYLLLAIRDGVPVPDEERSGSIDWGIGRAYDAVRDAVSERTRGFPPPEAVIERAVAGSGAIRFRGQEIAVSPAWDSACRELAAEIEDHVRRAWADVLDWADALVLAGGGAAPLSSHLSLPSMTTVPDPQWANAVGFLTLAQTATGAGR